MKALDAASVLYGAWTPPAEPPDIEVFYHGKRLDSHSDWILQTVALAELGGGLDEIGFNPCEKDDSIYVEAILDAADRGKYQLGGEFAEIPTERFTDRCSSLVAEIAAACEGVDRTEPCPSIDYKCGGIPEPSSN